MADNFLEQKREEYEKRKAAWLKSKKFKKYTHSVKTDIKEEADDFENQTSNQENEDDS
ncbi:MAG: dehydrogenase [Phocaeicola sp.]|uniref:dehydrogenase n=1 Tax=Phocaeicola TaxID=909656 RepID=UPI00234ED284|nr:dehydrogenase [Phocaeicola oris]MCE2615853.1 dehydrogenase [Phocaeicola oris]